MARPDYRDKILDTASALFNRHGIHATGVDTIIAESGVARMTLYKHFPSKEALVQAVLERREEGARRWLQGIAEREGLSAEERLALLFEGLGQGVRHPEFFGCPFINATAEYSDASHPVHQIAAREKRMFQDYIRRIVDDLGAADPAALARQIFLLYEGAIVTAQVTRDVDAARDAQAVVRVLAAAARHK